MACENWFEGPLTKFSNVYVGFNPVDFDNLDENTVGLFESSDADATGFIIILFGSLLLC